MDNVLISDYRLWDFIFELGPKYECFVSKKLLSLGYWALELLLDHEYWIFATGVKNASEFGSPGFALHLKLTFYSCFFWYIRYVSQIEISLWRLRSPLMLSSCQWDHKLAAK